MEKKYNNRFLLVFFVIFTGLAAILWSMLNLPTFCGINYIVPYLIIVAIGCIFCKKSGTNYFKFIPYNFKFKFTTVLIGIALVILLMPVSKILSEIGTMIGGDMLSAYAQTLTSENNILIVDLISTAVVPAVFEEFFFRGVFYGGFKKTAGIRSAIIWSSILFGIFHMNIQQALYAIFFGFVLAFLREITGSMWPGMIFHFVNNALSVIDVHYPNFIHGKYDDFLTITGPALNVILTIVLAVVGLVLSFFLLKICAKSEGKAAEFSNFFKQDKGEGKSVISPTFIISLVICVGMTILMAFAVPMMTAS